MWLTTFVVQQKFTIKGKIIMKIEYKIPSTGVLETRMGKVTARYDFYNMGAVEISKKKNNFCGIAGVYDELEAILVVSDYAKVDEDTGFFNNEYSFDFDIINNNENDNILHIKSSDIEFIFDINLETITINNFYNTKRLVCSLDIIGNFQWRYADIIKCGYNC